MEPGIYSKNSMMLYILTQNSFLIVHIFNWSFFISMYSATWSCEALV